MNKRYIIAIDGPSGSGKSTVSRELAKRMGYLYIDTGAMYRASALCADRQDVNLDDTDQLTRMLAGLDIRFSWERQGLRTLLHGQDVSEAIRTPEMSMAASRISAISAVRQRLLELQRDMGRERGVVMEGRDIGTVVFPDADIKFFLMAAASERARRRYEELKERGADADYESVLLEIEQRDENDSNRTHAPLRAAEDAITIDSSKLTINQVVDQMISAVDTIG